MPSSNYNEDFRIPFRNYVLADLEVNSLIGDKFFAAQIASLDITGSDAFPMAVFYPEAGSNTGLGIIKRFGVVIRAYSNSTYDEAYDVYRAITERLGGNNGPTAINSNIIIRPNSTPTETYEVDPRIYGVGSRFNVIWKS